MENKNSSVENLLGFVADSTFEIASSNSVCGQPFVQEGIKFIPVNKVSVNFAAGGTALPSKKAQLEPVGSGANVKLTPMSFIAIKDGKAEIINIQTQNNNLEAVVQLLINTAKKVFKKREG